MKAKYLVGLIGVWAFGMPADALTIHRSFTHRDTGFGSSARVSVPVDARVDKAIDEGRQAVRKDRSIVGRVTRVTEGDAITVTPTGGSATKVRLRNIDAPEQGQPGGDKATAFLKELVGDKKVEVKYGERDAGGRVFGTVYFKNAQGKTVDANLTMILNGWAWDTCPDDLTTMVTAYGKAEQAARNAKAGLWAAEEKPIRPDEWRKGKR